MSYMIHNKLIMNFRMLMHYKLVLRDRQLTCDTRWSPRSGGCGLLLRRLME